MIYKFPKLAAGDIVYYQPLNIIGVVIKMYAYGASCTVFFPKEEMEMGVLSCNLILQEKPKVE